MGNEFDLESNLNPEKSMFGNFGQLKKEMVHVTYLTVEEAKDYNEMNEAIEAFKRVQKLATEAQDRAYALQQRFWANICLNYKLFRRELQVVPETSELLAEKVNEKQ